MKPRIGREYSRVSESVRWASITGLISVVIQSICCGWLSTWHLLPVNVFTGGWSGGSVAVWAVAHADGVDLPRPVFLHSPHVQADLDVVGTGPL